MPTWWITYRFRSSEMKQLSNEDHAAIVRLLEWAVNQGGPSTRDANKRRIAAKILKKIKRNEK